MINIKPPYLGCAYYPEDWPVEEIEKDAAKMKATGIQVARIAEFAWSRMEKTEGVFSLNMALTFIIGLLLTLVSFLFPGQLAVALGSNAELKSSLVTWALRT